MDEAEIRRWASGRSRRSDDYEDDLRSASSPAPAAPAQELPALPAGMGWIPDPVHGWVAVPMGTTVQRQPQGVRGAPAAALPGGVVLPFRPRTTQLLRPPAGGETPYEDFLQCLQDIVPGAHGSHYIEAVVPDEDEVSGLPEMSAFTPVRDGTRVSLDPAADAFGGMGAPATRSGPLGR